MLEVPTIREWHQIPVKCLKNSLWFRIDHGKRLVLKHIEDNG